jgi:hypothetical protein
VVSKDRHFLAATEKALAGAVTGDCGKGGVGQAITKFVL